MYLAVCQRFKRRHVELVSQCVDARMSQETYAVEVWAGYGWVVFEGAFFTARGEVPGEVFAVVHVFYEGADGVEIFVSEVDASL